MSYQVNFRVYIPDCAYYEAEILAKLSQDIQEAVSALVEGSGVKGKKVGTTSAEISYLVK